MMLIGICAATLTAYWPVHEFNMEIGGFFMDDASCLLTFFAWWGRVAETASLQIVKVDCRIESGCYVLKIQTPQGRQQKNCCELNHSIS